MSEAKTECRCGEFGPLELRSKSINKRARETKALKAGFELLARDAEGYAALWKCSACGQLWQSGRTHVWHGQEYFFQVPPTSVEDWQREPFADVATLQQFVSRVQKFVDQNRGDETERLCGALGCSRHAIRFSKFCLAHHIKAMQKMGSLPSPPGGRLFAPYEWFGDGSKYLDEVSR
jgi:hypothetical protein